MSETAIAEDHSVSAEQGRVEPAAPPPLPPRLTQEEKLTLENLLLKVENIRLQQERLKQDFATSTKMLLGLKKEAQEYEEVLSQKYGVKMSDCTLEPDGALVPKIARSVPNGVLR
jgi:hypothetical protein